MLIKYRFHQWGRIMSIDSYPSLTAVRRTYVYEHLSRLLDYYADVEVAYFAQALINSRRLAK